MTPDRTRAKQIIVEIIRQSSGKINKTNLYKAFWLAHLFYAKKARGYLSDWPVVRMPNGPGIDKGDRLLDELVEEKQVRIEHVPRGPFTEITCRLAPDAQSSSLNETEREAIAEAVDFAERHSAKSLSEMSHEFSRSWNELPNGQELDIYTDLIPDDVFEDRRKELAKLKVVYDELFE